MSEIVTIARPYAKAAFDFALEKKAVDNWLNMLSFLNQVSKEESIKELLTSSLAPEKKAEKFIFVCGDQVDKYGQNFIKTLADNKRLMLIPEILNLFLKYKDEYESIVNVQVISASDLNDEQKVKIEKSMEKRLSCKVRLICSIDKSIIAGFIIRTDDMVIDSSISGRLQRLADALQS